MYNLPPNIHRLLSGLRIRQRRSWSFAGVLAGLAVAVALLMLVVITESFFWFSTSIRWHLAAFTTLLIVLIALAVGSLIVFLHATKRLLSNRTLARLIWARDKEVRDRILDAIDLLHLDDANSSRDLRLAAIEEIDQLARYLDPHSYIRGNNLRKAIRSASAVAAFVLLSIALGASPLRFAADRLMHPLTVFTKPSEIILSLDLPDTVMVIEGDDLNVYITARHHLPDRVSVFFDEGIGTARTVLAQPDAQDSSMFHARIKSIQRSLWVYARSGSYFSDSSRVKVIARPRVARLEVTVHPPEYTGGDPERLPEGVGDLGALPGSRAFISIEASRPLSGAVLNIDHVNGKQDKHKLAVDRRSTSGSFLISSAGSWWVDLAAVDDTQSKEPLIWKITVWEDETPRVEVLIPKEGSRIPETMLVPLAAIAEDDFGITRMNLRFRIFNELITPDSVSDEAFSGMTLNTVESGPGGEYAETVWNLDYLPLLPTDEVHLFVEAWDNDTVNGPKRGKSPLLKLAVATLEDLFTDAARGEALAEDDLEGAMRDAELLQQELEESLTRLRSNPEELGWEEERKLKEMLDTQEEILRRVDQAAESIEQVREELQQNRMVQAELVEKYVQLQELFEQIATPELIEAMEKLREAIESLDGERIREALEQLALNQEELLKSLDRSISILQQLRDERRLEELVQRARQLANREERLASRLQSSSPGELRRSALEQERLAADLNALRAEIVKTAEELEAGHPDISRNLQKLEEELALEELARLLSATATDISEQRLNSAGEKADRNSEWLDRLADRLHEIHDQMIEAGKQRVAAEMDRLFEEILLVSRRQEALREESLSLGISSPRFRSMAARQNGLIEALAVVERDAFELVKQTFFLGSRLLGELELAETRMKNAIARYTERRAGQATGEQSRTLAALHRSLLNLSQAQEEMQQAGSGTGYEEMMEKLARMTAQQNALNQGTMGLPMMGEGAASQLAQIAARQRALAEQMRRLEREGRDMKELLGELDGLSNSMEQVTKDLEDRNVTERTRRLQSRILQRLLDSQRSLQERETGSKRVSRTGRDLDRASPGPLAPESRNLLRERMLRALEGDYDRRWRPVIRGYFRALERLQLQPRIPDDREHRLPR